MKNKRAIGIVIILVLGFILINSMLNKEFSMVVANIPKHLVQHFIPYGKYKWLDVFLIHKIRKFTHCAEFCVLEFLICCLYSAKNNKQKLLNTFYISFSIALLDETIQLFSGRKSKISDVWIDLFGACVGFLIYMICKFYINKISKEKTNGK